MGRTVYAGNNSERNGTNWSKPSGQLASSQVSIGFDSRQLHQTHRAAAFLTAEYCGEIAEPDAQADRPRLAGELEVAMHEGGRYAAFTDGCCHALH
jgi:hypothetical protein